MTQERDWITEQAERQWEMAQQRQAWDKQRAAEAAQRERDRKQRELESYLKRRGQEWQDTTGTTPPADVLAQWQREYADLKEAEYQAERQARIAAAEAEYGF
jgi:hypothetical protein